jgi:hypothetical protein
MGTRLLVAVRVFRMHRRLSCQRRHQSMFVGVSLVLFDADQCSELNNPFHFGCMNSNM